MMDGTYFKDVYLKRINLDGENIQERTRTRKEKEFDNLFLKRTRYRALMYEVNEEPVAIECSVEPNKWNQDKIISNVLVPTKVQCFKTGDIFKTFQKVKDAEYDKTWIVTFVSDDITHGYQKYEVTELDSLLNLTDEYGNTLRVIPMKVVSETSVFVNDKRSSYGSVTYREPLDHRKFITQNFDFLEKGLYFDYEGRGWEISGKDDLSIKNVAFVSFEERLITPPEPITSEDILVGEDDNFFLNHDKKKR